MSFFVREKTISRKTKKVRTISQWSFVELTLFLVVLEHQETSSEEGRSR